MIVVGYWYYECGIKNKKKKKRKEKNNKYTKFMTGLIRCIILIVSSHFLSFLSFYYILSSLFALSKYRIDNDIFVV